MNSIGERLRTARVSKGLTQQELSAGIATKGFISQLERDLAKPSLPRLRLLADRLGHPISYFLEGTPPADPVYVLKAASLALSADEPGRALQLLDEVRQDDLDVSARAERLCLRGIALRKRGQPEAGLRTLHEAADLAPPDEADLNATIYAEIGAALGDEELFNESVEANHRALQWLGRSRHPDVDLKARVLTNLANDWYRVGKIPQSVRYFEEALDVATNAENLLRMANAHMALGITARDTGDLDAAIRHCDRALALHRRLGQARTANQILNNLGDAYFAQGRREEAWQLQEQCLTRGRQIKDHLAVATAAAELGRYALETADLHQAERFAAVAELASRRARNHIVHARSLALRGSVAERRGDPAEADRLFEEAFAELHSRGAFAELAMACAKYSDILRDRGAAEDALEFMRMAYSRQFDALPGLQRPGGRAS